MKSINFPIISANFSHACYLNISLGKDHTLTLQKKRNHYEVLGVNQNASTAQIKTAYIKLSKKFHPDQNRSDSTAHMKFIEINEAYSILNSPVSRRRYNSTLGIDKHHYDKDHPFFHARDRRYRQRQYKSTGGAYNHSNNYYQDFSSRSSWNHNSSPETDTSSSTFAREVIILCVVAAGIIAITEIFPNGLVPVENHHQNSLDKCESLETSAFTEPQSSVFTYDWQSSEEFEHSHDLADLAYPPGACITLYGEKVLIKDIAT